MNEDKKNIATFIASVPNITQLSPRTHILLLAYYLVNSGLKNFSSLVLKNSFLKARLPLPDKIDNKLVEISSGLKPALIKTQNKYVLSIYGDNELKSYLKDKPQIETSVEALRELLTGVKNDNQKTFLSEAIVCAEKRAYRAAIVMTWLFVINHMQEYVLNNQKRLSDFNVAMSKRSDTQKMGPVKVKDDFTNLRESVCIELMYFADIISKGVKKILVNKLDTRNDCAHPSDVIFREVTVLEFIDTLITNVVLKYA